MDTYVKLAKDAIEKYVKEGKIIEIPPDLPKEFYSRRAGIFVTIFYGRELRGCIGTILPAKENITREIIDNAVSACSQDYRFAPITEKELSGLKYETSILSRPEPVKNIMSHDCKKQGIIAKCLDGRCGLLLPDLEGVDSTDQQIQIACEKGNINVQNDNFNLFEFTIEKHR